MINQESKLNFVVSSFSSLEEQLLNCREYLPFIEQNKFAVSPKFVPIIVDSCSLVESIFKEISIDDKKNDFKTFSQLHESTLQLENAISLFLNLPLQFIQPFKGWKTKQPSWWKAYNALKHDRLNNFEGATYENTISALCGLHQIIARTQLFIPSIAVAGWLNSESDDFVEMLAARSAMSGLPELPVESKLYVSPSRGNFVDTTSTSPTIEYWDFSSRVKNFVLMYEQGF